MGQVSFEFTAIDSISKAYSAKLANESQLSSFFNKLKQLENQKRDRVQILHIGDSHIQAGYMTNYTRTLLQLRFGNAGMGLVFPYKVAHSNGPNDSYSFSNIEWDYYRNVNTQDSYDIGIKGHVIATASPSAVLKVSVNPKYGLDYAFNKMTLFHPKQAKNNTFDVSISKNRELIEESVHEFKAVVYKVQKGDYLIKIAKKFDTSVSTIKKLNRLKNDLIYIDQKLKIKKREQWVDKLPFNLFQEIKSNKKVFNYHTEIQLDTLRDYVFLNKIKTSNPFKKFQIDGIILENTNSNGLFYHMIGVNGARVSHYNKQKLFFRQLPVLKPDLIILSLGTNEIANNKDSIYDDLDVFFNTLRNAIGNETPILITTPPDYRRKENKTVSVVSDIIQYAKLHKYTYLNIYDALGGKGGMRKLQNKNLAQKDGVHLTANGYYLVGNLLYKAIMQSYKNHDSE